MDDRNKSWCPLPWISVNIRNNGNFRVCCHANSSESQGILRGEFPKGPLRAGEIGIAEARNHALLREIRLAMLKGERHPACIRCNREDDLGIRSRRVYEREYWQDSFDLAHAARLTNKKGFVDTKALQPGYLDLRFGNLCNLKCRMCGPTESSKWIQEHFECGTPDFEESFGTVELENKNGTVTIKGDNPYSWHERESFWEDLFKNLSDVKKIYLVGGEPLLIQRHYDLLNELVRTGKSQKVIVQYNSNITVIPAKAVNLWRHFKEVKIGASIDGYGKINDYIRHPSRWSTIEKNLNLLDTIDAPIKIWIATTVQLYNIYYLTDFLKWKIERGFKRVNTGDASPFITLHPLHNPPHYSIQALPFAAKRLVDEKFSNFLANWFEPYVRASGKGPSHQAKQLAGLTKILDGYRKLMWKDDLSSYLPEFWRRTKIMDAYRKESFETTMPEIAEPIAKAIGVKI